MKEFQVRLNPFIRAEHAHLIIDRDIQLKAAVIFFEPRLLVKTVGILKVVTIFIADLEFCPGVPRRSKADVAAKSVGRHARSGIDNATNESAEPGRDIAVVHGYVIDQARMDKGPLWVPRDRVNRILVVGKGVDQTVQADAVDSIVILVSAATGDRNPGRQDLAGVFRGALLNPDLDPGENGDGLCQACVLLGQLLQGLSREFRFAGHQVFSLPDHRNLL